MVKYFAIVMKKETLFTTLFVLILLLAACSEPSEGEIVTFSIIIDYAWDPGTPIDDLEHMVRVVPKAGQYYTKTNIKAGEPVDFTVISGRADVFVRAKDSGGTVKADMYTPIDIRPGRNDPFRINITAAAAAIKTPTLDDFDIRNMAQAAGSGVKPVTVTPLSGKSTGAITVYYQGTDGTTYGRSTTMPTLAGTYKVTFNVASSTGWFAATLSAGTLALVDPSNVINIANTAKPGTYLWNNLNTIGFIQGENYLVNITEHITATGIGNSTFSDYVSGFNIFINGGGNTITLSTNGNLLNVGEQAVTINNLTLVGLTSGVNGATQNNNASLVFIGGTFTMNSGKISDNYNSHGGSGVIIENGTFIMNGGTISNNNTAYEGGGVCNDGGTFIMNGGTISGNTASSNGGGVFVTTGSTFTMNGGTISDNVATNATNGHGGGVNNTGTFIMTGGTITDNDAGNRGGGVYNGSTFTMYGGTISENEANNGGGVYLSGGTFIMDGGAITENEAGNGEGGGVSVNNGTFTMNGGAITGNVVTGGTGGGVYADISTFTMNGGMITGNEANSSGGGVGVSSGIFIMNGGAISNNKSNNGGGVGIGQSTFTMNGGTISGNTANYNGGGVNMEDIDTFQITSGTIYGSNETNARLRNTAANGAALYRNSGTARYGKSGGPWTDIPLNGSARDDTIRVVGGALQP